MEMMIFGGGLLMAVLALMIFAAIFFRIVVSTNEVHIVQSGKKTVSYGKDQAAGNTYYKWPAWVPVIGVNTITLPVSVFDVDLTNYAAYDKGRVPFVIDIMAFFRIEDSNVAAQRVHSFDQLVEQLKGILQGACRSILASSEIEEILEGRSKFGVLFTEAVDVQLKAWGVTDVKNIELMDIRDAEGSKVIANIMEKKKSLIERESRIAVAENKRAAAEAEIVAQREVSLREQEAQQQVGQREAEKQKQVGISQQQAKQAVGTSEQLAFQAIEEQKKTTAERTMAVLQVNNVRQAEITREMEVVKADQERQVAVTLAAGEKQKTVTIAEGALAMAKLHAEGVEVEGRAKGAAETAVLLAPVTAQTTLAKEIGSNDGYQKYLLGVKQIEANQTVGVAQAGALSKADIKVIANTGNAIEGVKDAMGLFTSKGGTQLGAMAEAFAQTPTGAAIVKRLNGGGDHAAK